MQNCAHCSEPSINSHITHHGLTFCCSGCKEVYSLLNAHNLTQFYEINNEAGKRIKQQENEFAFLKSKSIVNELLLYNDRSIAKVQLQLPNIHCSACLWLLERLPTINAGIIACQVDLPGKQALLTYNPSQIELFSIARILCKIGYPPSFSRNEKRVSTVSRALQIKLGVTGFLFGNIMLMSFPEYLSTGAIHGSEYFHFFSYANMFLATITLLVAGREYLQNAIQGLAKKSLSVDLPIAVGITTIYVRSVYEVLSATGQGFFDSMAGLLFFLLVGKWYQDRIFNSLNFERDSAAFFPIAVERLTGKQSEFVKLAAIEKNDVLRIAAHGIIPADSILLSAHCNVDNAFITGESIPINVAQGQVLHAGGRNLNGAIEVRVSKPADSSYLLGLWNAPTFKKEKKRISQLLEKTSRVFILIILLVAAASTVYWLNNDASKVWPTLTAVLIIACPCALALTVPFTLGHARKILANQGFYTKHAHVIEDMAKVKTVFFDKTGTLTEPNDFNVCWRGNSLSESEQELIYSCAAQSTHPLSVALCSYLKAQAKQLDAFREYSGKGSEAMLGGNRLLLGSSVFTNAPSVSPEAETQVHVKLNNRYLGFYEFSTHLRRGFSAPLIQLNQDYALHLLTGDRAIIPQAIACHFNSKQIHREKTPHEKMAIINQFETHACTAMIGDGLNDAGAFNAAAVGIAIAEDLSKFTPASDVIVTSTSLSLLPQFMRYSKSVMNVVYLGLGLSAVYNTIGLCYAVSGTLTPLVAAVLMPLSSVSIVLVSVLGSYLSALRCGLKNTKTTSEIANSNSLNVPLSKHIQPT